MLLPSSRAVLQSWHAPSSAVTHSSIEDLAGVMQEKQHAAKYGWKPEFLDGRAPQGSFKSYLVWAKVIRAELADILSLLGLMYHLCARQFES